MLPGWPHSHPVGTNHLIRAGRPKETSIPERGAPGDGVVVNSALQCGGVGVNGTSIVMKVDFNQEGLSIEPESHPRRDGKASRHQVMARPAAIRWLSLR